MSGGGGNVFENMDWNIVSALSNIILSILTFVGLMVILYFSLRDTFYKLKSSFDTNRDQWQMKVITREISLSV